MKRELASSYQKIRIVIIIALFFTAEWALPLIEKISEISLRNPVKIVMDRSIKQQNLLIRHALAGDNLPTPVADGAARYHISTAPWVQKSKLTASDGALNDQFGASVSISGYSGGGWCALRQ